MHGAKNIKHNSYIRSLCFDKKTVCRNSVVGVDTSWDVQGLSHGGADISGALPDRPWLPLNLQ